MSTNARDALDPEIAEMMDAFIASEYFPLFTDPSGAVLDPEEARARGVAARAAFYPDKSFPVDSVRDITIPGPGGEMRLRIQTPLEDTDATIVYLHGGGWVIGGLDSHAATASRLACHGAAHVVQVEYRLAPEHPFPAAFDDTIAALTWVHQHLDQFGGNPSKLAIAGDSAGGNLAAAAAHHVRGTGIQLAAQLLLYPAVDLATQPIDAPTAQYLGTAENPRDPRVSPGLDPDLSALPATIIGVGSHDFLYEEIISYARRLEAADVDLKLRIYPTLVHGFFSHGAVSTVSDAAAQELTEDLRQLLHP
jgi:acetyl esterase